MTPPAYPWAWLADAVTPAFTVRYPWVDAVRRAGESAEAVCVLIPDAAGPLESWGVWLEGVLDSPRPVAAPGREFQAVAVALEQQSCVEPTSVRGCSDWVSAFLPAARRNF